MTGVQTCALPILTGHLPKVGDGFRLGNYAGVVTHASRRRVTEVRLTPRPAPPEPEEAPSPRRFYHTAE